MTNPSSTRVDERRWLPGTMGVAIASLVCGLLGFVPFVGTVALVLGVVALVRLRRIEQQGRAAAVTGLVLGLLATVFYTGSSIDLVRQVLAHGSGSRAPGTVLYVDDLRVGDCLDDMPPEQNDDVGLMKAAPCADSHEGEVVAVLTLPAGPWPGAESVGERARDACSPALETVVRASDAALVELVTFFPGTAAGWRDDRSIVCVVTGLEGAKLDHSVVERT